MTGEYELPGGFTVTFRIGHVALEAEWCPRLPSAAELSALQQEYRDARDHFLRRIKIQIPANRQ